MNTTVQSKLIKIGNSRGVRLPFELIEKAGLNDELELIARDGEILISNRRHPRQGWAEAWRSIGAVEAEAGLDQDDEDWLSAPLSSGEELF